MRRKFCCLQAFRRMQTWWRSMCECDCARSAPRIQQASSAPAHPQAGSQVRARMSAWRCQLVATVPREARNAETSSALCAFCQ
jgi:hypothetical protein